MRWSGGVNEIYHQTKKLSIQYCRYIYIEKCVHQEMCQRYITAVHCVLEINGGYVS